MAPKRNPSGASGNVGGNQPFVPGESDNIETVPNVPAAYQPLSEPAAPRTPPKSGGSTDYFNNTISGATADQVNKIINQYIKQFDANTFIDGIKYQGFNREDYIKTSMSKITPHQMLRLALMGAIRGANFEKIIKSSSAVETDLVELVSRKVLVRAAKKSEDITILRCTAAIPHWVALFMGRCGVPKKFGLACPNALQFPAAGSLPMSPRIRAAHVQFSIHFSRVIGGTFNENIYMAMFNNQVPLIEIPDELKIVLEANSDQESMNVDVAAIIATELRTPGRV